MSIQTRLDRLEATAPEAADTTNTAAICAAVVAAIDAGDITDWQGERAQWFISPTAAGDFFHLLNQAQSLVGAWAEITGWRAPASGWQAYRANSAAELRGVMLEIKAAI